MRDQADTVIDLEELQNIKVKLDNQLSPSGFECHPFKTGWYNDHVSQSFRFPHPPDTLAFVIISTPSMFEKAFIPFVSRKNCLKTDHDPLDECMKEEFSKINDQFPSIDVTTIHDFELTPNKRPKVLVQTAGHVSGAVRYYQRQDLKSDPWDTKKKIFGVCVHPKFGGWFALRGVSIFSGMTCPDLKPQDKRDILETDGEIVELLRRYNDHWEDWSFRDIIPVMERYSNEQKNYFGTKPAERTEIINAYRNLSKNVPE